MILNHVVKHHYEFLEFTFRVETFEGDVEDSEEIPSDYYEIVMDEFRAQFDLAAYPNHFITARCTVEFCKEDDNRWYLEEVQFFDRAYKAAPATAEGQNISAEENNN